tara:strand:- start:1036 stop:1251 length:216 start_codon:yes stop_codon:yes gene_type:complete
MLVKEADAGRTIAIVMHGQVGTSTYKICRNQEGDVIGYNNPDGIRVFAEKYSHFIRIHPENECVYVDQGPK